MMQMNDMNNASNNDANSAEYTWAGVYGKFVFIAKLNSLQWVEL